MRFSGRATYLLLVAAAYVLYLGAQGDLDLYIHPRYIVFTVVMSAIAAVVLLMDSIFNNITHEHTGSSDHMHGSQRLALIPFMIVVTTAIVLPARTLSSATVTQRTTDAGSIVTTANATPLNGLFAGSSKGLKMADWSRLLATNQDPNYYANRPAVISGFVYDSGLGTDTVWLARFVVTCCAVDAQPVGVPVRIANWADQYDEDEWLEVEGTFTLLETATGQEIVLQPESVTQIDIPEDPYAN